MAAAFLTPTARPSVELHRTSKAIEFDFINSSPERNVGSFKTFFKVLKVLPSKFVLDAGPFWTFLRSIVFPNITSVIVLLKAVYN